MLIINLMDIRLEKERIKANLFETSRIIRVYLSKLRYTLFICKMAHKKRKTRISQGTS